MVRVAGAGHISQQDKSRRLRLIGQWAFPICTHETCNRHDFRAAEPWGIVENKGIYI